MRMFVTVMPLGMERVSGSAPRFPSKMTLLTPRDMENPHWNHEMASFYTRRGSLEEAQIARLRAD
jgi:hypothetical protein